MRALLITQKWGISRHSNPAYAHHLPWKLETKSQTIERWTDRCTLAVQNGGGIPPLFWRIYPFYYPKDSEFRIYFLSRLLPKRHPFFWKKNLLYRETIRCSIIDVRLRSIRWWGSLSLSLIQYRPRENLPIGEWEDHHIHPFCLTCTVVSFHLQGFSKYYY